MLLHRFVWKACLEAWVTLDLGWPQSLESPLKGLAYIAALRIEASDGSLSWVTLREVASFHGPPEYCFWARNPEESSSLPQGSLVCQALLFPILKDNLQTNAAKVTGKKSVPRPPKTPQKNRKWGELRLYPEAAHLVREDKSFQCSSGAHHEYVW